MIRDGLRAAGALAVVMTLGTVPLGAETILSAFVGSTSGGAAQGDLGDTSHSIFGGTMTFTDRWLGFEVDGQYSPHFLGASQTITLPRSWAR